VSSSAFSVFDQLSSNGGLSRSMRKRYNIGIKESRIDYILSNKLLSACRCRREGLYEQNPDSHTELLYPICTITTLRTTDAHDSGPTSSFVSLLDFFPSSRAPTALVISSAGAPSVSEVTIFSSSFCTASSIRVCKGSNKASVCFIACSY
jgi:hypothetical protein